jgi:integrase
MRHTFASLLLQAGVPITYVSRQLGHKDSATTLRVYAHWLPESTAWKGVDCLDDTRPSATPPQPAPTSDR